MKEIKKYINYKDILSHIDIQEGDLVVVSSDILRFICVCRENQETFNPHIFIDSIKNKIGENGTLLFPALNWDFCNGDLFDPKKTVSRTGGLSNIALRTKGFKRTQHPMYSFLVWGNEQKKLCDLNNVSAWGEDSPYAFLHANHAKNLFIGINYRHAMSFVHYPEEKLKVGYRYFKNFKGPYLNADGERIEATYSMYVRDPELCEATYIDPKMDEVLRSKGAYQEYSINGIYLGLVDLHTMIDVMEDDIKNKAELVYPRVPVHQD